VLTVLFFRDFRRFTGGDLKVWDYFNHVLSSPGHSPYVKFSDTSVWDERNPWLDHRERVLGPEDEFEPDILFLSGVDWRRLPEEQRFHPPVPVINLVQHVKHADPQDGLSRWRLLAFPAIRICVSREVTEAIEATGRVHGPVYTIPDAIDVEAVRREHLRPDRDLDAVVVANKQPDAGHRIAAALQRAGARTHVVDTRIARADLLDSIGRSRVAVFVPNPTEGFYLPALEAMALETAVVCPDVVGNRSFCLPDVNCLRPPYDEAAIAEAAESALGEHTGSAERVEHALETALEHDLAHERAAFLDVLDRAPALWEEIRG
jgi:glycosyltransferase involved in cell wall biosynthesis